MSFRPAPQRRRLSVDVNQMPSYRHERVPSRTDSVSSEASSSSTLVEDTDAFYPYLDGDHVMMHLDYMLPIPEGPERTIPPSPSSSFQLEDPADVTPMASTRNLLSSSSQASLKPSLWLYRRQRPPPSDEPPTSSPTDTRASFLASLLHARWPKTESEDPIFGQTTPRALSPFRGQPRPPSQASVPRSILRADSRAGKSQRSLASVKFAERPGVWQYSDEEDGDDDGFPFSPGYRTQDLPAGGPPGWYGSRHTLPLKDSDVDSVDTYPPPRERERMQRNDSLLRRIISPGKSHGQSPGKKAGEKRMISGPMPLIRAASTRELKETHKTHGEIVKGKPAASAPTPKKSHNKLRNFWGRYVKVS